MQHRIRSVVLWLALTVVLVVAGYFIVSERFRITDVFEEELSSIPFNGIVVVEVLEGPDAGLFAAAGEVEWKVSVTEHLYDRGPYASVAAGRKMVDQALPAVDTSIVVSIPKVYALDLGATYILVVAHAGSEPGSPQSTWPWQSRLVLDRDGALLLPAPGSVADDVEAVRYEGESDLDAALAFFLERAETLDAAVLGDVDEVPGDRLAIIAGTNSQPTQQVPEGYAFLDPKQRQLPGEIADAIPGAKEALGIEAWAPWRMIVTYDESVADEQWFALLVDDYGFIGPIELPKDQSVTELHAFGPAEGTISSVMLWPFGVPSFAVPVGVATEQAVEPRSAPIDLFSFGSQERRTLDDGGAIHVSLEDGAMLVTVVSHGEARELVLTRIATPEEASEPREDE